ncbi:MAG: hypothetical protein AAFY17_10885 [Cyanobacteria bacterium J06642_11]
MPVVSTEVDDHLDDSGLISEEPTDSFALETIESDGNDSALASSVEHLLQDQMESPLVAVPMASGADAIADASLIEDWSIAQASSEDADLTEDWSVAQASSEDADQDKAWQLTLWGGPLTDADVGEALLFDVELVDSYIVGVAGNRPIVHFNDRLQLEGEVQVLKHFGDQDHFEFTAGLGVRWQVADSVSLAFLDGLSLATDTPELEEERADKANPLLNYFALEVEVDIAEDWALAARLHHRSGVFGLFNGVKRGSNAYLFGLRHTL